MAKRIKNKINRTAENIKAAKPDPEVAKAKVKTLKDQAALIQTKTPLGGFTNFLREQGIIGLAVGLAIGAAAGDTVKKLVEGFINPVVQFIVGSQSRLENAQWTMELWGRTAEFKWGAFISSLITLIATAFVIYLIIHALKFDRLDKKKDS